MIKIGIVDDEPVFCNMMKNILLQKFDNINVYTYSSVNQLDKDFDFILLDINMPDCDGVEFAKKNEDKKILFVSCYDSRCKEAFGPNIYGFIGKDNLETELVENVSKMLIRIEKQNAVVVFKVNREKVKVKVNDIIYCTYIGGMNIVIIANNKQITVKNKSFKDVLEILGNDFIPISRRTAINKNKVFSISDSGVYLKGIKRLFRISRRQRKVVLKAFLKTFE
ncbi:LytR/AlgR family response regulator transcription factor [Thomasclavelia cocleata]|uniref:Response regulatory domain-containing protein n=1 Tax=Thomasclavelia cocleata TaxID=69824 RepID=A0A829Z8Y3_9FIRM|nr:response regulator [Thomasclavelia cocleata]GFI40841.1 hypothetical protein IMSAGC017_00878 [Thomasclavelia cocleata]